jgi:hypothetical protein
VWIQAQQLIELEEAATSNTAHWAARIETDRLSFQKLLNACIRVFGRATATTEIMTLLKLLRKSADWSLSDFLFRLFYPDFSEAFEEPAIVFEHCVALWKRLAK